MIVIEKSAEEKLIQYLDINETQNNNRRCALLKTSEFQNYDLRKLIDFIHDNINDQNASIFVCEDRDIFVLARCIGAPFIKQLQNFLLPTPQLQPALTEGLATLFEVRVDRHRLLKIAEEKLKIIENQKIEVRTEQDKQNSEKKRSAILNQPVAHNLIETLSQRRIVREETEILVVEDDPFSQKLIKNALPHTVSISLAGDGQNAIAQYVGKAPDIMFLDIGLPDIDGHDVLGKIFEYDPQAFVIMLSGKGDKENITRAMKSGAKGFVGKPFTPEKLLQYIQKSPHIQKGATS